MKRRSNFALATYLCAALSAGAAHADTSLTVETGVGHSDNITRVETGAVDETIATAGVDLDWEVERPRFSGVANLNADYFHYLDDTYDSEVVGSGDARLSFAIVPERFNWMVQETYGQQSNDPFVPVTPETREDVNVLTTGPEFAFRVGDAVLVRMFGQYALSTYETSPIDSERTLFGASVGRPQTRGQGLSFNVAGESIAFEDQPASDYDRRSAYLAYGLIGARTELSLEGGYTWLEPEAAEETGAPRVVVEMTRRLSSASTLVLRLGSQLTDSSEALGSSLDGPMGATPGATATADPYENRSAALSWRYARRRTSLELGTNWNDDTYETQTELDRKRIGWTFAISRQLGARLSASVDASIIDEDFGATGFSAKTSEFGASLNWLLGQSLRVSLQAERSVRTTSTALGEYTENRAYLRVYYIALRGTPDGGAAP